MLSQYQSVADVGVAAVVVLGQRVVNFPGNPEADPGQRVFCDRRDHASSLVHPVAIAAVGAEPARG